MPNISTLTFNTTTTWTCPPGVTMVICQGFGGGGSGGGGSAGSSGSTARYGGGGGAGSMLSSAWVAVVPGTIYTVTVGAGGGQTTAPTGQTGGDTSFGSLAVFSGASGGQAGVGTTQGLGGATWKNNSNTNQYTNKYSLTAGASMAFFGSGCDTSGSTVTGSLNLVSIGSSTLFHGGAYGVAGINNSGQAGGLGGGGGGAGPGGIGGDGVFGGSAQGGNAPAPGPGNGGASNSGAGGGGGGAGANGAAGSGTGGTSGNGGSGQITIWFFE